MNSEKQVRKGQNDNTYQYDVIEFFTAIWKISQVFFFLLGTI